MTVASMDVETLAVQWIADVAQEHGVPWLIEGLWTQQGVGFLCGSPKACKTWVALDLAISVATQTAALGRYPVAEQGPVLLFAAEDAPVMVRARLAGMAEQRGLALDVVPIHLVLASSLRLENQADQERLEATVAQLRPKLIILDPFVRLSRADENSAREVSAVLASLRALQRAYRVAIVVVHHTRKQSGQGSPSGLALRGSGDFWAWADTTLYLQRKHGVLHLTPEHRSAAASDRITLELCTAAPSGPYLRVCDASLPALATDQPLDERILEILARSNGSRKLDDLRTAVHVRMQTLVDTLRGLQDRRRVERVDGGWALAPLGDVDRSNDTKTGETEAGSAEEQPAEG